MPVLNWSGAVRFTPKKIAHPKSAREVAELVRECVASGMNLRVMGARHSFSPLIETDGMLLSLDEMKGVRRDPALPLEESVWAESGIRLHTLSDRLDELGLALENMGDINVQALAGAVSTGTHGTGIGFGTLSTQVAGLKWIDGSGEEKTASERDADSTLFKAAQTSLGALGVLTEIRLRASKAYRLKCVSEAEPLERCVAEYRERIAGSRNFEFFWFPYTDTVMSKTTNVTDEAVNFSYAKHLVMDLALENLVLESLSRASWIAPPVSALASRCLGGLARLAGVSSKINSSHRVFATPRLSRFNEMEYGMPIEALPSVFKEVRAAFEKHRFRTNFPIEVRFVQGDDIFLSPAFGRDSVFVAVHVYKGMPFSEYFSEIEKIFLAHSGRPHWGKMHSQNLATLSKLYPKWDEFQRCRERMDPKGIFLSPYLKRLFVQD